MLSVEQEYFIRILRDFINAEKCTKVLKNLDIDYLTEYGKKHEVLAIIYYQTRLPQFLKAYSSAIYINTNREKMLQEIMKEVDFPIFPVKGADIAKLYPEPLLRTMGDTDIVVHTKDREKVHELLQSQGYVNCAKNPRREWQYYKNRMEFELHDRLIYTEMVNNSKQEAFFNDFWPYVKDNHLNQNFHFLFLIAHIRKHFMNEGVGFRHFMDIAVLARYADLDWKWIEEKADEIELLSFLRAVLSFCNRWFGTKTPLQMAEISDEVFELSTIKIFKDGVFGFNNEENTGSSAVNLHRKEGNIGMWKATVKKLFLPYRILRKEAEYAFIDGKPFLLPIAWIYRIALKSREKDKKKRLSKTIVSSEVIRKREELYRQWGL